MTTNKMSVVENNEAIVETMESGTGTVELRANRF